LINSPYEGYGDFNDVIFQITTSGADIVTNPEPSTVSILGLGLAGMLAFARKFRK
jgi:hypothetical protein